MKSVLAGMAAALLAFGPADSAAQSTRSLINDGNDMYSEGKYADAEVRYRKALEKEQQSAIGKYNLGNALHRQGKYDEALKQYEALTPPGGDPATRARTYYNAGNTFLRQQKYGDAIGSYVESLKLRPDDFDAKYNLSYALRMLKQQQQQKQQPKDDKTKQDQQKQQQQNKDQQQQQPQQQRPQQQERKISKADAERILEVLKNNEREVQKKLRARQQTRPRTEKDW